MENNNKSVLKTVLTIVGGVVVLAGVAAALCVLYKKYKASLAKFNEEECECDENCCCCEETENCQLSDCEPEVEVVYAEDAE